MREQVNTLIEKRPNARQLCEHAHQWDREFTEVGPVATDSVRATESELIFGNDSIAVDQAARGRLFDQLGAPSAYLQHRSVSIQTDIINEHLRQRSFGGNPCIVLRDGEFFKICQRDLVELHHAEAIGAVVESLGEDADNLFVTKINRDAGNIDVELVSPTMAIEVRQGDVVQAGLYISHSRFGDRATQIQSFIYRLVCRNGLVRRECVSSQSLARTRKLPTTNPRAKELQIDQIRRLTGATWQKLGPQLAELRSTAERRTDARQLLKTWLQRARVSTRTTGHPPDDPRATVLDRLLHALRTWGEEDTYYGAVNALTYVGTHDFGLSARQRRMLSDLGGVLHSRAHTSARDVSQFYRSAAVLSRNR